MDLIKNLIFAIIMVPVVMAIIFSLIYGLGEILSRLSSVDRADHKSE